MQPPTNPPLKQGMAITSLVLGILSIPTCGLAVVGALIGVVLGIMAFNKSSKEPLQYGGKGIAIAGIVTSVGGLLFTVIAAAIALPQLNNTLKLARETTAIVKLNTIHSAEAVYHSRNNRFGTLQQLAEAGLIDPKLTAGDSHYSFTDSEVTEQTYCVHATRRSGAVARRDFNITEEGIVHSQSSATPAVLARGAGTPVD